MMISSKGRYALYVMIDLSQQPGEEPVALKAIAQRQELSVKYAESIVATLVRGGLVRSVRGKEGGYRLARPAQAYTVAEIVKLTEGNLAPVSCVCDPDGCHCTKAGDCLAMPMWQQLDRLIDDYLSRITLADLAAGHIPAATLLP